MEHPVKTGRKNVGSDVLICIPYTVHTSMSHVSVSYRFWDPIQISALSSWYWLNSQAKGSHCRRFSSHASLWCHKIFARAKHVKSDTSESSGQISSLDDSLLLFPVFHSATFEQLEKNNTSRVCALCSGLDGHLSKCKKCLVAVLWTHKWHNSWTALINDHKCAQSPDSCRFSGCEGRSHLCKLDHSGSVWPASTRSNGIAWVFKQDLQQHCHRLIPQVVLRCIQP